MQTSADGPASSSRSTHSGDSAAGKTISAGGKSQGGSDMHHPLDRPFWWNTGAFSVRVTQLAASGQAEGGCDRHLAGPARACRADPGWSGSLQRHRQEAEAAEDGALARRLTGHRPPRHTAEQRGEEDAGLDPGQRRAETAVDPAAEGERRGPGPGDVEGVRITEPGRIPVA